VELMKKRLELEKDLHVLATLIKAIGFLGREFEIDVLREYLSHGDSRVRANTIEGLARADHDGKWNLFRAMLGDTHHRVRLNAALELEKLEPGQVERQVIDLFNNPEPVARKAALWGAQYLEERKHHATLVAALGDGHPEVCLRALALLDGQESPRYAKGLIKLLEEHPSGSHLHEVAKERLLGLQASTSNEVSALARRAVENSLRSSGEDDEDEILEVQPLELRPKGTLPPGQRKLRAPSGPQPESKEQVIYIRLAGQVVDGRRGEGLKQATVRISSSGRQETTDRRGRFYFERLEGLKVYVFVVEKMGYPTTTFRYRASAQKDQSIKIRMRSRGARGR
jgi:hypothetical protein